MRPAPGDPRLRDRRPAARTRFAVTAVDPELVLHRAALPVRAPVVAERRALSLDAEPQCLADAAGETSHLLLVQAARRPERVEPRVPERLVDVDVPETGDRALIEQRRLQRRAAAREPRSQP